MAKLPQLAADKHRENKRFFERLRRRPPKDLDRTVEEQHHDVFSRTDCLACANCCKTTGPLFVRKDVERISKYLKMGPAQFYDAYLRTDEDGDAVLQDLPCTFLGQDNRCLIYDVRPKACREYPHTDRKKLYQIGALTLKNVAICPAAYQIVEKLKAHY